MDESEYNEYLCKKMKNVVTINNSNTNNNTKRKKRVSRYRGFGSKRGLNLRVKLRRFWVRARFARWLKLRLNCLSRALQSLFKNISTITSTRHRSTSNSTKHKYNNDRLYYNHHQYSFGRSNSFYAEAIADCLEFIKRSSSNNHHHCHDQQQSHLSLLS